MGRRLTFEWDRHNTSHIARHDVTREEFEDAFNQPMVEGIVSAKDEDRVAAAAKTSAGRYLYLVYTMRRGRVRPVTAYTLPMRLRRAYDEKIKNL